MITLAEPAKNGSSIHMMQIKEIAEREQIPSKYLEQILLSLKNAGLLHSKMGVGGGYYLARSASEITLGQIFRVLDGCIGPINCVNEMAYEPCGCPDVESCGLRLAMMDVRNAIAGVLDFTSLEDVARREQEILRRRQPQLVNEQKPFYFT